MEPLTPSHTGEYQDGRVIRFRKPFSEKYTLTVTTDILAGSFPIQTKAQIRWALRVINVDNLGQAEIDLITIENQLLETNNPNLKDIAALSQAFSRMYSEIHVKLNPKGKVIEIINLPVILGKWEATKAEMQKIEKEVPALQSVVQLNDEIFADPDKVKIGIESNEFFNIYFHLIYGEPLPNEEIKRVHRNIFNSVDLNWQYSIKFGQSLADAEGLQTEISVLGKPIDNLGLEWSKSAYSSFDMIDHSQLNPELSETGQYHFRAETGKLLEAVLVKEEVAHPDYIRGKMTYILKGDGEFKSYDAPDEPALRDRETPIRQPDWEEDWWRK